MSQSDSYIEDLFAPSTILLLILCLLFFLIGIWLHYKIISISRREKDMTWKHDITNSIMITCHYAHSILMHTLTRFIPDLHHYTGNWFCYVSRVLTYYGNLYITGHSLMICYLKYILIVKWAKASLYGKEKIINAFFFVNIFHPCVTVVLHLIVYPDFIFVYDGVSYSNQCLGERDSFWKPENETFSVKLHHICEMVDNTDRDTNLAYSALITGRKIICYFQITAIYAMAWNIIEIALYWNIFSFARRKILPHDNNVASRCLNDSSNALNEKKIHINAQVTAVITFFEMSCNVAFIIILAITKKTSFLSLLQVMLGYHVILPYAFLMNTSHNKNRIVEQGWINVFRNLFGCIFSSTSRVTEPNDSKGSIAHDIIEKNNRGEDDVKENKIFTVSKNYDNCGISTSSVFNTLNCPTENSSDPSASSERGMTSNNDENCGTTNEDQENHSLNLQNNYSIARNLASNMSLILESEEKEEVYIHYFKQIVMVNECNKQEQIVSEIELSKEFFLGLRFNVDHQKRMKHHKKKQKTKTRNAKISTNDMEIADIKCDLSGTFEKRRQLRKELLVKMTCPNVPNDPFDILMEKLIDLEEGFIQSA